MHLTPNRDLKNQISKFFLLTTKAKHHIKTILTQHNPRLSASEFERDFKRVFNYIYYIFFLRKRGWNFHLNQISPRTKNFGKLFAELHRNSLISEFFREKSSLSEVNDFLDSFQNWPDTAFYNPQLHQSSQINWTKFNRSQSPNSVKSLPDAIGLVDLFLIGEGFVSYSSDMAGELFELLMQPDTRSNTGAFFTPKEFTEYITHQAFYQYVHPIEELLQHTNFQQQGFRLENPTLVEMVHELSPEEIKSKLQDLHVLDPACGSGHFLVEAIRALFQIYDDLYQNQRALLLEILEKNNIKINRIEESTIFFEIYSFIVNQQIFGIDINAEAVEICRLRFLMLGIEITQQAGINQVSNFSPNLKCKNSLIDNIKFDQSFSKFEIIIGNPPYGDLLSNHEKDKISYSTQKREVSALFLQKSMAMLNPTGILGMLTSYTITFSKSLSDLRTHLNSHAQYLLISTFDRDKCRVFMDMTQSVSILLAKKKETTIQASVGTRSGEQNQIYTTEMYREFPGFANICYFPTSTHLLSDTANISKALHETHRLSKISRPEIFTLIQKLHQKYLIRRTKSPALNQIKQLITKSQILKSKAQYLELKTQHKLQHSIYVRISGNYWYNAWAHPPYFGTQVSALFLQSFPHLNNESVQQFMLLLINSSFYYVWFRIYSDGRHMNQDILGNIPLPREFENTLSHHAPLITKLAQMLDMQLHQVYDPERKRFRTSEIKPVLDLVDYYLAIFYELDVDDILTIINYDSCIRGEGSLTKSHMIDWKTNPIPPTELIETFLH